MTDSCAVSELVGALLLVSIVALALSMVTVAILSRPVPEDIPQLTAVAKNESKIIYLTHTGGNALQESEIKILVNGMESPFSLEEDSTWPWSPGKKLVIQYEGEGMPEYLQLIYRGGSEQTLLLTEYFVPVYVTGIPTTIITTQPTTLKTTIPTPKPIEPSCSDVHADFSANVTSGDAPLTVAFTDNSTSHDNITGWSWAFGDGNVSSLQNPVHTYASPGTYTVSLTASNSCGSNHTIIRQNYITVQVPPACGTISGTKYHDLNKNGQRDPGEPGLSGWTIEVYRKQGNNWIFVKSGTTGSDGTYMITGLQYHPAEQYLVKEIVRGGWIRTQPVNEDYYDFIVLNPPHCYETDVDFGNWAVPTTLLNTERYGYVRNGGQISFTVKGSYSHITVGGNQYSLNVNDRMTLEIMQDSTNVEIDMNSNRISRFSFPSVRVSRGGSLLAQGAVTGIWISQYSGMTSSLSIIVPAASPPVWTQFEYSRGTTIINGQNGQRIELRDLYPRPDNGFMRLDIKTSNTYYDGAATSYQLT